MYVAYVSDREYIMGVIMTMNENCEQLKSLVKFKFDKEIEFYALPKTNNTQELLENEIAVTLIQNKNLRSFFKADSLVVPIYRGTTLDGAVMVRQAEDLDKTSCHQITELIELLVSDILSINDDLDTLYQKEQQLEKQVRLTGIYSGESPLENVIH